MRRALVLFALAVLAATANASITGRVMDPDGKPLAGVRVRAFAPETPAARFARLVSKTPQRDPVSTFETKGDGAFTVDAKGHGVVTLLLDAPDRDWRSLEAVDGEDAGTFVLRPAKSVRGRVTAGGKGVANARIVFGSDVFATSGEDGSYEVAPMGEQDPSSYVAIHPDYAPWTGLDNRRDKTRYQIDLRPGVALAGRVLASDGRTPVAGATIHVNAWPLGVSGDDGTFRIAHAPQAQTLIAIHGQRIAVTNLDRKKDAYDLVLRNGASVSGIVRSAKDGRPVSGARVSIDFQFNAYSDARGNYTIAPAPATSGFGFVQHPSYTMQGPTSIDVAEGARATANFDVMPLARVRGTVVDEERRPVAAARVSMTMRGGSVMTGPDGTFVVRAPSGQEALNVFVSKAGYGTTSEGPLSVKAGETKSVQITLRKGFRFEIALVDGDGKPIAGEPLMVSRWADPNDRRSWVPVVCTEGDLVACGMTDESGRRAYEILDGKYEIFAGGTSTVNKTVSGVMIDARTAPMTIRLERGLMVAGRVVDADDKPVENAYVAGSMRGNFRTDANGAFSIANLPAGTTVTLTSETMTGLMSDPVTVTAPATDVLIRLPRPARVEGRVFDRASKEPVREFSINVARERRGPGLRAPHRFTPDDGRFSLDEVTPGEVDIAVQARGYVAGGIVDVKTTAGATTTVEIALDRGAIVKGRVTSSGQPVPDVTITVSSQVPMTRGMQAQRPVRTDSSGEFTIDGVTPGAQRLEIRKAGYVPLSKTIDVAAGQETRADLELDRGRELHGRVLDDSGRPVPNAEIMVRSATFGPMIRTDAEGSFALEGLADRTYTVVARKDGYTNAEQEITPQTTSLTLTLGRGGSISGRVTGVAAGELQAIEVAASDARAWRSSTRPDDAGNFVIQGVPDGRITVRAVQPFPIRRESETKQVEVVSGTGPFVQLDFTAGLAVRGRITRDGVPIEGSVNFFPSRTGSGPRPVSTPTWAQIGAGGTYEVRLAEPGEYDVRVNSMGGGRGFGFTEKLNVTASMTHDIEIKGATLRGRVIDETTGEPIAGARLDVSGEGMGGVSAVSDSTGRFSFDGLTDARYRVVATRERYVSDPLDVVVSNGLAADVELRLRQATAVGVKVVDAADGRVLDAAISTRLKGAKPQAGTLPSPRVENGVQRLWLLPGSYIASVWSDGYLPKTIELVVPGPDLHVMLERSGRIVVTGIVAGAAELVLRKPSEPKVIRSTPMQLAQFANVAPGTYRIEVLDAQRNVIASRDNVQVVAGQTTTIMLP